MRSDDVPANLGGLSEQVLVLVGVRDGDNLCEALSAAKARFPDGRLSSSVILEDANL